MQDFCRSIIEISKQGKQYLIQYSQPFLLLIHPDIASGAQHNEVAIPAICCKCRGADLISYRIIGIVENVDTSQQKRSNTGCQQCIDADFFLLYLILGSQPFISFVDDDGCQQENENMLPGTVFYQEISDAVIHRSVIRIPTGPITQEQKNGNQTDKKYSQQNTVYFFH